MGLMHTSRASLGDPKVAFPILGLVFLVFGLLLCAVSYRKEKQREVLLREGIKTKGTVTQVKQLMLTKWNGRHPYVVYFSYDIEGLPYKGKSGLLWSPPSVCKDSAVTVYADSGNPARGTVDL